MLGLECRRVGWGYRAQGQGLKNIRVSARHVHVASH